MIKVFLSHKSEDKGFVRLVANKLQKESIELDELSFEETQKNIDEIYRGIDESGVFVLFIPKNLFSQNGVYVRSLEQTKGFLKTNCIDSFPL